MKKSKTSDYIKYRNGKWLQSRKRIYFFWYKHLQIAEEEPRYTVDWSRYRGWGGRNIIVNQKFDQWWEERWERLFGIENRNDLPRYPLSTAQPKADAIRQDLLVYQYRHLPNNLEIADAVVRHEKSRGRKVNETLLFDQIDDPRKTQSFIGRCLRRVKERLGHVCKGSFP